MLHSVLCDLKAFEKIKSHVLDMQHIISPFTFMNSSGAARKKHWGNDVTLPVLCVTFYVTLCFLIKYMVYSTGLKYLHRNKVSYFGMHCIFV